MSELMKKHPTEEEVSLTFTGPNLHITAALEAMRNLGFKVITRIEEEDGPAIPWRESRHYIDPGKRPGLLLSGARFREGLTQAKLAEHTGIPRRHISEMENGRRPIGKSNAKKLAGVLNIDPRRLLTL
jgi:DNA-binding XRE family transcriptional regulator